MRILKLTTGEVEFVQGELDSIEDLVRSDCYHSFQDLELHLVTAIEAMKSSFCNEIKIVDERVEALECHSEQLKHILKRLRKAARAEMSIPQKLGQGKNVSNWKDQNQNVPENIIQVSTTLDKLGFANPVLYDDDEVDSCGKNNNDDSPRSIDVGILTSVPFLTPTATTRAIVNDIGPNNNAKDPMTTASISTETGKVETLSNECKEANQERQISPLPPVVVELGVSTKAERILLKSDVDSEQKPIMILDEPLPLNDIINPNTRLIVQKQLVRFSTERIRENSNGPPSATLMEGFFEFEIFCKIIPIRMVFFYSCKSPDSTIFRICFPHRALKKKDYYGNYRVTMEILDNYGCVNTTKHFDVHGGNGTCNLENEGVAMHMNCRDETYRNDKFLTPDEIKTFNDMCLSVKRKRPYQTMTFHARIQFQLV